MIAQLALRTIHEILISTPGNVIELVTFYGKVSTTDPATGQPIQRVHLFKGRVVSGLFGHAARPRSGMLAGW